MLTDRVVTLRAGSCSGWCVYCTCVCGVLQWLVCVLYVCVWGVAVVGVCTVCVGVAVVSVLGGGVAIARYIVESELTILVSCTPLLPLTGCLATRPARPAHHSHMLSLSYQDELCTPVQCVRGSCHYRQVCEQ